MRKLQLTLAILGLLSGLAVVSASGQSTGDKTSGSKMTHAQMMDKMSKMSTGDKAGMYDKMSEKDKMMAMKMSGHDMSKMSSSQRSDMMGKMSTDDKAAMFDKMSMDKKMAMMKKSDK